MREILFTEGYRADFYQAVRLLERLSPDREPVGRGEALPSREVARFRSHLSLSFPPSEIYSVKEAPPGSDRPPEVTVNFMGLTGPQGVLPHPYTELLIERARYKDTAAWGFFDIFTHRAVSLMYRAWEKYRFHIAYERGAADPLTEYLFDVIGMGTAGLKGRMSVDDQTLLLYAGLIAQRPHSAVAVESVLRDYFGAPVRLLSFFGQWLELDPESVSRVGAANSTLGTNLVSGSKIYNRQSKFRLRFGPLRMRQFLSFLPRGTAFAATVDLTRFLVGLELDFDVQLVLLASEVPPCQLSSSAPIQPMLGWTSWLTTKPLDEDPSQVILSVAN